MEQDNEVSGNGNSYTTEFRQYDPRLGRWKSLDPLMKMFPTMSPYNAFANNPIYYTDPYGLAPTNGDEGDPPVGAPENPVDKQEFENEDGLWLFDAAAEKWEKFRDPITVTSRSVSVEGNTYSTNSSEPIIEHDNGFLDYYEPREPTQEDRDAKRKWYNNKLLGAKLAWWLNDATDAYEHFLYGKGEDYEFSMYDFIREDDSGEKMKENLIHDAKIAAERLSFKVVQ